jgi:hypothetical protein
LFARAYMRDVLLRQYAWCWHDAEKRRRRQGSRDVAQATIARAIHDVEVAIQALKKVRGLPREARRESLASLATLRARQVSDYLPDVDRLR